jgi:quercetin dioxygenase-like cupin family protein
MSLNHPPGGPAARSRRLLALPLAAGVVLAAGIALQAQRGHDAALTDEHALHMAAAGSGAAAAPSGVTPKVIACEPLPHVPGKSLTTVLVTYAPGAKSPAHRHAGSVTVFMLKGTMESQLNYGPTETFKPGGTWFEPPGTVHSYAGNPSPTEPAEFLATFVADHCAVLTTYLQ